MILEIKSLKSLDKWLENCRELEHDVVSLKGPAPVGATYGDGTLIVHPVNVAWRDVVTNDVHPVEYTL